MNETYKGGRALSFAYSDVLFFGAVMAVLFFLTGLAIGLEIASSNYEKIGHSDNSQLEEKGAGK